MFIDSLVEMPTRVFTQKVKTNTNKKCLKALKRQKILLLSESQRMKGLFGVRKKIPQVISRRLGEFPVHGRTDECPKYLFQYVNPKTILFGVSKKTRFPRRTR